LRQLEQGDGYAPAPLRQVQRKFLSAGLRVLAQR
jgi:hypothetical protein